jgi:hypothetical protein
MSRNVFTRFTADVVFAGSNYIPVVQPVSAEVRQLLLDVRDLLARVADARPNAVVCW